MMDKPKRKNSPTRRRQFLLMVILPIFALIAGFMALSQQIDAWLATDPFTPPCEMPENYKFLVYGETYITDFEGSHYFVPRLDDYGGEYYEYHFWYDEQKYLVHMMDGGMSYPGYTATWIVNMETKQSSVIPDSLRYNVFARSRQFLAKGSTFTNRVDVVDVFNQELLFREQLPFNPFKGFLFSTSEEHVLIYGDENSPSYIFDLTLHELQTLPDINVIGWLDNVHLFYETDQQAIYTYHIETGEQIQFVLEDFESDPPSNKMSKRYYEMSNDRRWIVLEDNDLRFWVWDTQQQTHHLLDSIITRPLQSIRIQGDYLIYNFTNATALYGVYSFFDDDYEIYHPYAYPLNISPSGKYALEYVQRANSEYHLLRTLGNRGEYIFYELPKLDHRNWISINEQDYVFYSVPLTSNEMGERQYYLIDSSSGNRCKIGIWDSSEDFTIG